MFSLRYTYNNGVGQRRLLSSVRPVQRYRSLGSAIAVVGASSIIAAYFLLPDYSRSLPTYEGRPLNPSHFTPATLIKSVQTSPDTKLLTFHLPPESMPRDNQDFTPIWSVFIKDDDIQVERPYTPLQGLDNNGNMSFWIKKYDHGEVARWLHSKQLGASIELRGPLMTWRWKDDKWDDIIMVSGGTGITPFYQLLHSLFSSNNTFNGRLTLLHSSRTFSELPPAQMMEFLSGLAERNPDKFKFRVFVDSMDGSSEIKPRLDLTCDRIGKSTLQDTLGLKGKSSRWRNLFPSSIPLVSQERKVLVLVCGPEKMVNAIAGPYGRNYSQGKVAGILGELGLQSHQVWKL